MISIFAAILAAQSSAPGASQTPTQACFEIFADSEGEMARAADLAWRRKAQPEIEKMRAESDRRRSSIDRDLGQSARKREQLQRAYDRKEIEEDDFTASRSEIEAEVRQLVTQRDTLQIPACGF